MAVENPQGIVVKAWNPRQAPRSGERVRYTANEIQDGEDLPRDYEVIDVVHVEERKTGAGYCWATEHRVFLILRPASLPWHSVY